MNVKTEMICERKDICYTEIELRVIPLPRHGYEDCYFVSWTVIVVSYITAVATTEASYPGPLQQAADQRAIIYNEAELLHNQRLTCSHD